MQIDDNCLAEWVAPLGKKHVSDLIKEALTGRSSIYLQIVRNRFIAMFIRNVFVLLSHEASTWFRFETARI